jgi:hypothetical protein
MKKLHIYISLCLITVLTSCEGWLHITPKTQVPTEDFYKSETGFEDALIGCYVKMNSENLYGKFLTMCGIDYMAQYYDKMAASSVEYALRTFDYENTDVEACFTSVYNEMYNIILQANDIIEHIDSEDALTVVRQESKRRMIKGEALAIRAFCHFDILRIFGQLPKRASVLVALPYSEVTGVEDRPLLLYRQYVEKLQYDLADAEELLSDDPVRRFSYAQLNNTTDEMVAAMPDLADNFFTFRRFRFNYYAVRALSARVALYAGNLQEAYQAAMEVIGAKAEDGTGIVSLAGEDDFLKGHYTLPSETLLALSNAELEGMTVELEQIFKNGDSSTDAMRFLKARRDAMFQGRNTANNNRYNRIWGEYSGFSGEIVPYLKKYFQNEVSASEDVKLSERWQIPLIRLSEVYLIAMESSDDLSEVNALFYDYMVARNEQPDAFASLSSAKDEILNEYRREFMAEGQMFFAYKRLNTSKMLWNVNSIKEANYIVPVPRSENKK